MHVGQRIPALAISKSEVAMRQYSQESEVWYSFEGSCHWNRHYPIKAQHYGNSISAQNQDQFYVFRAMDTCTHDTKRRCDDALIFAGEPGMMYLRYILPSKREK